METTLKKGMVFEAGSFTTIEVSKKHGTKFKVTVKDESIQPFAVEGFVMSKADIMKHTEVVKKKDTQKYTKLGANEMKVLMAVAKKENHNSRLTDSTIEEASITTAKIVVDGLNTFQIAGYVSMLERKNLLEFTMHGKIKDIGVSATATELFKTLERI